MIGKDRVMPVSRQKAVLPKKESFMARRIQTVLPMMLVGVILSAACRPAAADEFLSEPSDIRLDQRALRVARLPTDSPLSDPAYQAAHFSQPEQSDPAGGFDSRVPIEELVAYAMANNPQIQAARYQARSLGARVPQAVSLPDPMLMTTAFLDSIETAAGPQEVMMSLSQKFPLFGKRALRSQVAYHHAMAAYAQVTAVELQVIERVKKAYFDIHFLQRAIDVTRAMEPRLKDVIEIARTKYETNVPGAGLENVFRVQVELSNLKMRLIELHQSEVEAQARLASILHLRPPVRIDPVEQLRQRNVAHTAELLFDLAESSQPELSTRRREICRDRAAVDLACRSYYPDATVSFNWHEIGTPGLSPVATGDDAFALGVGVNLPIYRTRLDAAVREAQYKASQSARRYAATQDQIRGEVAATYAKFVKHDQMMQILGSEIVPRAAQTLDLSIEAYGVRNLDFQKLIDNYTTYLRYQIDYYKQQAMREQTIASLERAVGTSVVNNSTALPGSELPAVEESLQAPLPPSMQ